MSFKFLVPLSFVVLLTSFWNRNNLYENMPVGNELRQEPVQTKIRQSKFSVNVNHNEYQIQPVYDYEIYGLVVSYKHHDGEHGLHELWNDHLNVADFCVIWSKNAFDAPLQKLEFWNGQFTCNVKTSDRVAWAAFNMSQLSNNHLLTTDEFIRDQLKSISIGDQIRIKGWLVNYQGPGGGSRNTSTTREDAGNGACETIFVNELDILHKYSNGWRKLMYGSLVLLILSLFFYLKSPPRLRHRG